MKVRVKAVVGHANYSGDYPYVTGVIQGSGSDEEVLELGHAFETGAQDNATGVAGMLEAVAALTRLIEAGRLPRPKRSIRILVMPEDYGSFGLHRRPHGPHEADHRSDVHGYGRRPVRRNRGLQLRHEPRRESIVPGRLDHAGGGELLCRDYAPVSALGPVPPDSDSFLSDPTIGVPTIAASGSSGVVNVHHNSADTLDRVDPRSLRDLSSIVAAFLYYLASAGEREIPWLAEITLDRGYENAVRVAAPYLDRLPPPGIRCLRA